MPLFLEHERKPLSVSKLPSDLLLNVPKKSFLNFMSSERGATEGAVSGEMVNIRRRSTIL